MLHQATFEQAAEALAREEFDFIVLSGLLNEVDDPDQVLELARSLCSPATVVHVNTPNARSLHNLIGLEMGLIGSLFATSSLGQKLQRRSTFDLAGMRQMTARRGFQVVDFGTYFLKPFTSQQMAEMKKRGLIDDRVLEGLYAVSRHFPESGAELFVNLKTAP